MVLNMLCLGVLALQLQALQAQRDALAMQAAVGLAQDLWERMQLFPQASLSYQLQLGQIAPMTDCKNQAQSFMLSAIPLGAQAQDACGSLTLGHTGERGVRNATLSAATCWER